MTVYATIADMRARISERHLIQLTDTENEGVVDEVRLQRAIDQGANAVQGYVAKYYAPSDLPVPALLIDLNCDLAHYRLYETSNPPEQVERKHKDAMMTLDKIARGLVKIDNGEEAIPERDGLILRTGNSRLFTRSSLRSA